MVEHPRIREIELSAKTLSEEFWNDPDIELAWAAKGFESPDLQNSMNIYFKLLLAIYPKKLKFTCCDDKIYSAFRCEFPTMNIEILNESDMRNKKMKMQWIELCKQFKDLIPDYDIGTILRVDSMIEYTKENSILVPRIQFYAIEIARSREGANNKFKESIIVN